MADAVAYTLDPAVRRRLYARRAELGFTQRALAKRMATSQSHISDLENGQIEVTFSVLSRWAEALGLQVAVHLTDRPKEVGSG